MGEKAGLAGRKKTRGRSAGNVALLLLGTDPELVARSLDVLQRNHRIARAVVLHTSSRSRKVGSALRCLLKESCKFDFRPIQGVDAKSIEGLVTAEDLKALRDCLHRAVLALKL